MDSIRFAGVAREQRELELFNTGFDATWELDLFGGARRAIQAANAERRRDRRRRAATCW